MEYKVLRRLSSGHVPGDVVTDEDFEPEVIEVLVERGALRLAGSGEIEEVQDDADDGSTAEGSRETGDRDGRDSVD